MRAEGAQRQPRRPAEQSPIERSDIDLRRTDPVMGGQQLSALRPRRVSVVERHPRPAVLQRPLDEPGCLPALALGPWLELLMPHECEPEAEPAPQPDADFLTCFFELRKAPVEDIAAFAEQYGPLGVCPHGRSLWEPMDPEEDPCPLNEQVRRVYDAYVGTGWYHIYESVAAWRKRSGNARDMLLLAARGMAAEKWGEDLTGFLTGYRSSTRSRLQPWLQDNGVRLQVAWPPGEKAPRVMLQAPAVLGMVGIRLAAALTSPHGLYECKECGDPFTPEKPPRGRHPKYCPRCNDGPAHLAVKRASWRRNRDRWRPRAAKADAK